MSEVSLISLIMRGLQLVMQVTHSATVLSATSPFVARRSLRQCLLRRLGCAWQCLLHSLDLGQGLLGYITANPLLDTFLQEGDINEMRYNRNLPSFPCSVLLARPSTSGQEPVRKTMQQSLKNIIVPT